MTKSFGVFALTAAAAVVVGACSDTLVSPTRGVSTGANLSATVNASSITLASDAGSPNPTQFCSGSTKLGVFTTFPALPALTGCANARDLQADGSLAAYNPGWDNPNGLTVTTGHWVGFTAGTGPSSDYRPTPGLYYYSQSFTVPTGATAPSLSLDVLADNVAAVYLNGTLLGSQTMTDCNSGTCNWQIAGKLHVTAASGLFNASGTPNTLVFVVNDVPTGFPVLTGPVGGSDPQYGCTTRSFQATGSTGFPAGQGNVNTSPNHVGPHPTGPGNPMTPTPTDNVANPGQDGCENPSGLAFAGTVSFTPAPPSTIWCSPGFWKTHQDAWPVSLQNQLYNSHSAVYLNDPKTFVGYDFGKKDGSNNPTLDDVISNPNIYTGSAANNVASWISNQLFGTPITANPAENCPLS